MKLEKKRNRIAFIIAVGVLLIVAGVMIVFSEQHVQGDFLAIATCLINIVFFLVQLLRAVWKRPFGFDVMFWLFNLFFLGFVPLLQHLTNVYAWDLKAYPDQVVLTNLLILLWAVCYTIGRESVLGAKLQQLILSAARVLIQWANVWIKKLAEAWHKSAISVAWKKCCNAVIFVCRRIVLFVKSTGAVAVRWIENHTGPKVRALVRNTVSRRNRLWERKKRQSVTMKTMDALLVVSVLIMLCHIAVIGLGNLFSRATAEFSSSNTTVYLLFTHVFKNTVLFTMVLFVIRLKKTKRIDLRIVVAAVCLLVCCFPTALSRNMMASFYAGLLIISLDWIRKNRWFFVLILGGLVLLFPAMEIFRYIYKLREITIWDLISSSFGNTYLGGHYDAHQMFISVENYVREFGITWGKQMLGALLFFVPRAIWPGKPVGTGHLVISALDQFYFTNVSAPLVAEGYVNFGVVGVIVFAVMIGAVCNILDERYWKNRRQLSLIRILYPFTVFQFFFLLRGDMMSGWAYLCAQVIVGTAIWWLAVCRGKPKTIQQD